MSDEVQSDRALSLSLSSRRARSSRRRRAPSRSRARSSTSSPAPRLIRAEVIVLAADGTVQDYADRPRRDRRDHARHADAARVERRRRPGGDRHRRRRCREPAPRRRGQLRRGMRVVVYQVAGQPAQIVQGESINAQLFGPRMIRAEVLLLGAGGSPQDYRIDRGVVVSAASGTLTLRESNGDIVPALRSIRAPRSRAPAAKSTAPTLRRGLRVVVYRSANAAAELVQVEGSRSLGRHDGECDRGRPTSRRGR